MCFELITARIPGMAKALAGELSKRSHRDKKMLPLRAQRMPKQSTGSNFIVAGNSPGQACSCGILQRLPNGGYQIFKEALEPLSRTVKLLASESGQDGFEFAILELSSTGPPLPPKNTRAITFERFAKFIGGARFPESTIFIVKPVD